MVITHKLLGSHVVQDPLGVLTVMAAFHDGQKQLGCIILGEKKKQKNRESTKLLGRDLFQVKQRKAMMFWNNALCRGMQAQNLVDLRYLKVRSQICDLIIFNSYVNIPKYLLPINLFPSLKQMCREFLNYIVKFLDNSPLIPTPSPFVFSQVG